MSVQAVEWVYTHTHATGADLACLAAMAWRSYDTAAPFTCDASAQELAGMLHVTDRHIRRHLEQMCERGFLQVTGVRARRLTYTMRDGSAPAANGLHTSERTTYVRTDYIRPNERTTYVRTSGLHTSDSTYIENNINTKTQRGDAPSARESEGRKREEGRKRHELRLALLGVREFGAGPRGESGEGEWGKIISGLLEAKVTPEEIPRAVRRYHDLYPTARLTLRALLRHIETGALLPPPPPTMDGTEEERHDNGAYGQNGASAPAPSADPDRAGLDELARILGADRGAERDEAGTDYPDTAPVVPQGARDATAP